MNNIVVSKSAFLLYISRQLNLCEVCLQFVLLFQACMDKASVYTSKCVFCVATVQENSA